MRTVVNKFGRARVTGVLVVMRFRAPDAAQFRQSVEAAHSLLAAQKGYVGGWLGHNVDDPELWVLTTLWEGPGAYRRAIGAFDVKAQAWGTLGQAIDEPSAYELVVPGDPLNEARARQRQNP
jgi:hypothetical protein